MSNARRNTVFDRRVAAGAACWVLTVVFFVGEAVAQSASNVPYSLYHNTLSDLGSTACGPATFGTYHADVCSPLNVAMNATFVICGLLTAAGALGTWPAWPGRRVSAAGLVLLVLAGAGEVVVGLRPENISFVLHTVGATFALAGGNLGLLLLGAGLWRVRPWAGALTILVAVVGLAGVATFNNAPSFGLGVGLVERVAAYPLVLWLVVAGACLLGDQLRRAVSTALGILQTMV